jgi:hypothetical protein
LREGRDWPSGSPTAAPITLPLAEFLLPKLATGRAGSLQFQQGPAASAK